jgi:hypothetical protein
MLSKIENALGNKHDKFDDDTILYNKHVLAENWTIEH